MTVGHKLGSRIDLVNEVWYHGNMTSDSACKALRITSDGTFLVRNSSRYRGMYVLSVKKGQSVEEFYIVVTSYSTGNVKYEIQGTNNPFNSLQELVYVYMTYGHPISTDGEVLKQPYPRESNVLARDKRLDPKQTIKLCLFHYNIIKRLASSQALIPFCSMIAGMLILRTWLY